MHTIKLKVNEKIYNHLMWFLNKFSKDEIQVIDETEGFVSVQKYLEKELHILENGKPEFISLQQLDDDLEATIRKYED